MRPSRSTTRGRLSGKAGRASTAEFQHLRLAEGRIERVGGGEELDRRAERDEAAVGALDLGGTQHVDAVSARHDVERVAGMEQAHRPHDVHARRAEERHLAADAAQVGQEVAGREAPAIDDPAGGRGLALDRHPPVGKGADEGGERLAGSEMRLVGEMQRGVETLGEGGLEGREPGAVEAPVALRPAGEAVELATVAGEGHHEGAGAGEGHAGGFPPGGGLAAEADHRLLGRFALAVGRDHAAGPPRAVMGAGRSGRIDYPGPGAAPGELRGDGEAGDAGAEDGDRRSHGQREWK